MTDLLDGIEAKSIKSKIFASQMPEVHLSLPPEDSNAFPNKSPNMKRAPLLLLYCEIS